VLEQEVLDPLLKLLWHWSIEPGPEKRVGEGPTQAGRDAGFPNCPGELPLETEVSDASSG
jgi:hypothetical protein